MLQALHGSLLDKPQPMERENKISNQETICHCQLFRFPSPIDASVAIVANKREVINITGQFLYLAKNKHEHCIYRITSILKEHQSFKNWTLNNQKNKLEDGIIK